MRLRTKLVLAFLLLSVVPLLAATVYSYVSSIRAFRRAVEAEASTMAVQMSRRMETVTADLGQRLAGLQNVSLPDPGTDAEALGGPQERLLAELQARMGDAAELVESLQFTRLPPGAAPPSPPGRGRPGRPATSGGRPSPRPRPGPRVMLVVPEPPKTPTRGAGPRWVFRHVGPSEMGPEAPERPEAPEMKEPPEAEERPEIAEAPEAKEPPEAAERPEAEAAGGFWPPTAAMSEAQRRELERAQRDVAKAREEVARAFKHAMADRERAARAREREGVDFTVRRQGEAVGTMKARLRSEAILRSVLSPALRRPDEIPFALDADGRLHATEPGEEARLKELNLAPASSPQPETQARKDWVVVSRKDPESGLTLGIARPVGSGLKEIRQTAVRNLGLGLAIVGVALVGVVVISGRMTRNLDELAAGAERLGRGDLETRVPVRSGDEIGRLADTFNRMAAEMRAHQDQLLEQERLRKELEMCRRIQEEMLPHAPLRVPFAEVKGVSLPAREVGGDFFNYFLLPDGEAALLVGDVSGKGVPAALLMANVQATLRARLPVEPGLAPLAEVLDHELARGGPAYLTLFLAILDGTAGVLRYVNAGHNAPLLLRADGTVEALPATGRPLGLYPGGGYEERRVGLHGGETLFLYTDGLVEAEDGHGDPFGMDRLQALLVSERTHGPDAILAVVEDAVRAHRGGAEAADDATLVALRVAS